MITVKALTGDERLAALRPLAELRIKVFREWPYLYDGTLEYEQIYLEKFAAAQDSVIVVAKDGDKIIGASTASPLLGHADEFSEPFKAQGFDPARIFYFGESVLRKEYRGHGIGNQFFEQREAHARASGKFDIAAFCAVIRDPSDPRKPDDYNPLDPFWNKHGFTKQDGLIAEFKWREPGADEEVNHQMQFWMKKL